MLAQAVLAGLVFACLVGACLLWERGWPQSARCLLAFALGVYIVLFVTTT